jgi:methyl-accepting chemotaxis protein
MVIVSRGTTRDIRRALDVANTVASGDLSSSIAQGGRDEAGQLLEALRTMNGSLVRIVQQVRQGSDNIASASSQIASGNADLSQRTESQAANLEETAASMQELTGAVQQSAETAQQASQLATQASKSATQGGQIMAQMLNTMEEISASSRRIDDITSVIDGIAFQTNILALNAAVEAARAGEQGRGFAVVATEVRTLAKRSADAAKEIKTLIGASVERIGTGAELATQAGDSVNDIVHQVQRVSDLIAEISTASLSQSSGIAQIGAAISQLDQATQQNASLVEESANAADSLSAQARQLSELVGVFRVESRDRITYSG